MFRGNTLKGILGKLAVGSAVACIFAFVGTESAEAQWCGNSGYQTRHYNHYRHNTYRSYHGSGVRVNVGRVTFSVGNPGYGYYRPRHTWHDTSHWDYHPTRRVWHGNHWDVIPGHYSYHRTGHWHHHHR